MVFETQFFLDLRLTYDLEVDVLVLSADLDLVVPPGDRCIGDRRSCICSTNYYFKN